MVYVHPQEGFQYLPKWQARRRFAKGDVIRLCKSGGLEVYTDVTKADGDFDEIVNRYEYYDPVDFKNCRYVTFFVKERKKYRFKTVHFSLEYTTGHIEKQQRNLIAKGKWRK